NNHDNMGTIISWNTFVSYSLSQTWKSKMWKYVQCRKFCNNVRIVSLVQFKNSRIRIFKITLMIDPMQSNEIVHTKTPSMNIFTSTPIMLPISYTLIFKSKYRKKNIHEKKKRSLHGFLKKQKHSDLAASKYIKILLAQNKVGRVETISWVWNLQKFRTTIHFDWNTIRWKCGIAATIYTIGAKFSVRASVPIWQLCAYPRYYIIVYVSLDNAQINLQ
ncbi:hypothetical protein RFI_30009, partial [Reticulomyxa filosa]